MIYRAISKKYYSKKLIMHFKTKRVPSNIPYIVDNILEWLRPDNMPSRRNSVFASNSKDLALMYATNNDYLCSVRFKNPESSKIVKLQGYDDAKLHPDIKNIPKIILNYLGQDYLESELKEKESIELSKLFLPALNKEDIESILPDDLKNEFFKISTFWKDSILISVENEYEIKSSGEIFFYAEGGYYLDLTN